MFNTNFNKYVAYYLVGTYITQTISLHFRKTMHFYTLYMFSIPKLVLLLPQVILLLRSTDCSGILSMTVLYSIFIPRYKVSIFSHISRFSICILRSVYLNYSTLWFEYYGALTQALQLILYNRIINNIDRK